MELCQAWSWPCKPRASQAWPGPAALVQGSRHSLAQQAQAVTIGGWSCEAPTYGGAGCLGVQRLQG